MPTPTTPKPITLFTIGFTGKSAREFFERLQQAGVKRLVDTRLKNVSQLAGFAKKKDLEYFLRVIANIDYAHLPLLAPTADLLQDYQRHAIDWQEYERRFQRLMLDRQPENHLTPDELDRACLLCSEPAAEHCHRRLVAEHLRQAWGAVHIQHL